MNEPRKVYALKWIQTSEDYWGLEFFTDDEKLVLFTSASAAEGYAEYLMEIEFSEAVKTRDEYLVSQAEVFKKIEEAKAALVAAGLDPETVHWPRQHPYVLPTRHLRYEVVEAELR
jgi:hypothetical protein